MSPSPISPSRAHVRLRHRTARRTMAVVTTAALMTSATMVTSANVAVADPQFDRIVSASTLEGRTVELLADDSTGAIGARVDGAVTGDAVWLDRSIDGFQTHTGLLGYNNTVLGDTLNSDPEANLSDRVGDHIALFRACVHIDEAEDEANTGPHCTDASRSRTGDVLAAANGFNEYYNPSSKILDRDPTGIQPVMENGDPWWPKWWHTAVATSALVGSAAITGDEHSLALVDAIYEDNKNKDLNGLGDQFRNDFIDDTGWWAMAWVDAYRVTGEVKYLNSAKVAADFMAEWWNTNTACGGLYWKLHRPNGQWEGTNHLSAISNGLYLQVNAALFQETGESRYLARAHQEWDWYSNSGLIGSDGLVLDGVNQNSCTPSGDKYTYNQGVLISGLVEFYHATSDASLLTRAQTVANALTTDATLSKNGILRDTCEPNRFDQVDNNDRFGYRCGNDGPTFKGPAVRGLAELNATLPDQPYTEYLNRQIDSARSVGSIQSDVRDGADLYGLRWFDRNSEYGENNQDTDPNNANLLHIGNQVAGAMLANANALSVEAPQSQVTLTTSPASPTATGWYHAPVTATATATPASDLEMSVGAGWQPYTGSQHFADGQHLISVRVPGTGRIASRWLKIDSHAPTVTAHIPEFQRVVTLSASDTNPADSGGTDSGDETGVDVASGLDRIEYRLGEGPWLRYSAPVTVPLTQPGISYRAFDVAGNVSATHTHNFGPQLVSRVQVSTVGTTIGTTSSLTARVSATDPAFASDPAAVPTGTIQVSNDGRIIASGTLQGGLVTVALPSSLKVGTHTLQVLYSGSGVFRSASAGSSVRIAKGSTTIKVKAKKKVKRSKRLKVTTTVRTSSAGTPRGKVRVRVARGKKQIIKRTVKLNAKGKANLKLRKIKKRGKYTVRVDYRGNAQFAKSKVKQAKFKVVR